MLKKDLDLRPGAMNCHSQNFYYETDELMSKKEWIHVSELKPDPKEHDTIIVWDNVKFNAPVICVYDYGEWCDVVDSLGTEFEYWQPGPKSPYDLASTA